jgi:hypothetical protein
VSTQTVPGRAIPASTRPGKSARFENAWSTVVTLVGKGPAATQALAVALIAIGIAFQWWHWSDAQTGDAAWAAAVLLGMSARSQVTLLLQAAARGRRLIPAPHQVEVAQAPGAGQ